MFLFLFLFSPENLFIKYCGIRMSCKNIRSRFIDKSCILVDKDLVDVWRNGFKLGNYPFPWSRQQGALICFTLKAEELNICP